MLIELNWTDIIDDYANEIRQLIDSYDDEGKKSYHIVLIGDNNTGKSTYKNNLDGIKFNHLPTMVEGVELSIQTFEEYLNYIWTIRSEDNAIYQVIENISVIDGVLGFFDLTNKKTFHSLQDKVSELIMAYGKLFPLILIGNKADDTEEVQIKKEDVLLFAYELGDTSCHRVPYVEMSALKNNKLEDTISNLIHMVECDLVERCAERPALLRKWCTIPTYFSFYDEPEERLNVIE